MFVLDLNLNVFVPWCFFGGVQTDKASMLDEAIEYLKQLQLQVQVSKLYKSA